jgi:hypothetical protein
MSRSDDRRDRVISLCGEIAAFLGRMNVPEAQPFYLRQADRLRGEQTILGRRRIYRTIYSAANTGAGGMSDRYITKPDGTGDVPATEAYYKCLHQLLKATRTFP